ncbi:MAG: hypothetical protein ACUVTL_02755 [Thermoproteota archaeon]
MIAILFISMLNLRARSSPNRSIEYYFTFDNMGLTLTNVTYIDDQTGNGSFWMLVPKGSEKWSLRAMGGSLVKSTLKDADPSFGRMIFYENLTLYYSGPITIFINWTLDYGALLLEPQGLFVSPAIYASSDVPGYAKLNLSNKVRSINYATPRYTKISDRLLQFDLRQVMREGGGRIYVFFSLYGQYDRSKFTRDNFTVTTASRYKDLAERVLSVYSKAAPILQELFNVTLGHTFVEFFIPSSTEELPIGGFVPILPDRFSVGNVSLNLFYFRTQEGYIESIALHELVHHYCAKAGIAPSLLWLHEGLANYVSIEITYFLGLPGARDLENSLEEAAAMVPKSEYHMVDTWTTTKTDPRYSEFQHYAVAYSIISDIGLASKEGGEPFDGYNFFEKIFRSIVQRGQRMNSTWHIVSLMEAESKNGSRIASMFLSWNFNIPNIFQIQSQIDSLRERLSNPSPIISLFVPSILVKLDEAENYLENQNLMMAQQLVREAEAFVDRISILIVTFLLVVTVSIYLSLSSKKPREAVGVEF